MKKHLYIFILIIYVFIGCFLLNSLNTTITISTNNGFYGKILNNTTMLLKTPTKINSIENNYFLLEETYFVKILNEENDDFYYVEYLDLKGYVYKNNIELVTENVTAPYLENIEFDITKDCHLFSEPSNNVNAQILSIKSQTNVSYYGKVFGDEIGLNSGNVWYYAKIKTNNQTINGYIHSSLTNNLSPIISNSEITTSLISQQTNNLLNLKLNTKAIIIVTISLPTLFLLFILLKGFKKA